MPPAVRERSVFDFDVRDDCVSFPFHRDGRPLEGGAWPLCFLSLRPAGSMRFRLDEPNPNRDAFFSGLRSRLMPASPPGADGFRLVPLELLHSRAVYAVGLSGDGNPRALASSGAGGPALPLRTGDGVITRERGLVPVVTVADCVPVYLLDPVRGCFGVVHSGWRGTGIAADALRLAADVYGSVPSDFCAVVGPHIHVCCYRVDRERAELFAERYGPDCVAGDSDGGFRLSLAAANVRLLLDSGVPPGNILHCTDCTCCDGRLGSFRRETAALPPEGRLGEFTPMAAFAAFPSA